MKAKSKPSAAPSRATVTAIALPPVTTAKLPANYEHAKDALASCSRIDECIEWRNKSEAIASYARQADDDSLFQMATRIKARAIRRCGELLKAIKPATGGQPHQKQNGSTRGGAPPSRAQVAKDAGLSTDQRKQALRVAEVPAEQFEAAIESPKPATVTQLAELGKSKQPSLSHLHGRDPEDFKVSTRAQALVRDLAAFASSVSPATVARGALDHEYDAMRANARKVAEWIGALIAEVEKVQC